MRRDLPHFACKGRDGARIAYRLRSRAYGEGLGRERRRCIAPKRRYIVGVRLEALWSRSAIPARVSLREGSGNRWNLISPELANLGRSAEKRITSAPVVPALIALAPAGDETTPAACKKEGRPSGRPLSLVKIRPSPDAPSHSCPAVCPAGCRPASRGSCRWLHRFGRCRSRFRQSCI